MGGVYFLKIHPNFALTSKHKNEERKKGIAKNHGVNLESRSQLNKATGLRGVIPAVLKFDGTPQDQQTGTNLLLFSPLGHNCDFKFNRHLKYHPMQSINFFNVIFVFFVFKDEG